MKTLLVALFRMKFVLLLAALLLVTASARAAHVKLFVLTGQSNSLGTTDGDGAEPSPGADAADKEVRFF